MKKLTVDVWSDIACPWCYVGKRRLEAALARFPHRGSVELRWRAFELDPSAPAAYTDGATYARRLGRKYGRSEAEAQGMIDSMTRVAAGDGLTLRFDRVQPGSTFDAHRLIHLAGSRGMHDAMKERLLRAYFTEGEAVSDRGVLARLAAEVGIDASEVDAMLESDRYVREVRDDEREAREMGVRGVPFFAVGGKYGVSGAQPADQLLAVLARAWDDLPDATAAESDRGAACGPDGCEV